MTDHRIEKWQEAILVDAERFSVSTQANFRALTKEAEKHLPLPESRAYLVNTFCDVLVSTTAYILVNQVSANPGLEETVVRVLREKFKEFRQEKTKRQMDQVSKKLLQEVK